jgi:rhamnosyltransferase subunit B
LRMKVLLFPAGSHGDVHPFVGVGLRLRQRGHDVTLATSGVFADLAARCQLKFHEVGTAQEFRALADNPDLWHPRKAAALIAREALVPGMRLQFEAIRGLATPGETVVVGSALGFGGRLAHEALGLPFVTLHLQPSMFWSVHESPYLARHTLLGSGVPGWLKNWQFRAGIWLMFDRHVRGPCNAYRRELGLPPIRTTWEMMHSPQRICAMFPDWFAPRQPDWPRHAVHTGFPRWDEREISDIPPEVDSFLSAGDPPIVFTPGSAHTHATGFWRTAVEACARLGRRGLLLTRHGDQIPRDLPGGVRHFDYVPFSQALPRCAALVYHGGIGTLSQALAAGLPHVIMPMAHDQPDNAARIRRLGVGDYLWPGQFRGPRLAALLERLLSSAEVAAACRSMAGRFQGDDAIGQTCDVIEAAAGAPPRPGN